MQPGETIAGRFKLIDRLGEGGMGVVWRGEQTALGRAVAIKVIHHEVATPEMRERFAREAELAARVHHRNVIDIVEYGTTDDGDQFLVMPLLRGETVATRLARLPRPDAGEVLGWMRGILGGLAAIHDEGIVHRDLKPANVFLAEDADGVLPKLLDFGISRSKRSADASLTRLGTAIGTPQYMAPEQFESSKDLDNRADIYAAGAVLYEALTGKPPFDGTDAFAIYREILSNAPVALASKRPDLPVSLSNVVQKALARDPADRFSSAREMREALTAVDGVVAHTPPPSIALAPTASMDGVVPLTQPKKGAERTKDEGRASRTEAMDVSGEVRRATATKEPEKKSSALPWILGAVAILGIGGAAVAFWPDDAPAPPPDEEPEPVAPTEPMATRVAGPMGLHALALAWSHLPAELRAIDVRLAPSGGSWVLIAAPGTDAAELSAALGSSETAEVAWSADAGYRPAVLEARVRANMHTEPSRESPTRRVLLHGALVVGLYGTIDGHASAPEGEGAQTYFIASPVNAGWALSAFFAPHPACIPVVERIAHDVEASPEVLSEDTLAVRTPLSLTAGREERAYMLIARDRASVRSWVAVYDAGPECQLGERRALHAIEGVLDEVFVTETARAGGESLLAISWHPSEEMPSDGVLEWAVFDFGGTEPLWTDRIATAPFLRSRQQGAVSGTRDRILRNQREHFVLSTRLPGERTRTMYRWVDESIVRVENAAPAPVQEETEEPSPEPPPSEPEQPIAPNPFGE